MSARFTRRHILGRALHPHAARADRAAARAIVIVQAALLLACVVGVLVTLR
ncbi:hypothetical protein [Catellatospora chokoriensis]|uniref:Uncharacterized protein n=1 Tax=Catellatospora chokoriensis TaxID=310353 RepID=A0A8J3K7Z8_9ACTN|nr:hypothetical protein [Catellatospora chokoriensis]GIF91159.1 hypothetical protein Cch02nite_46030 [Catellatospora chokoriensis]